jgi:hypothetical protein
LRPECAGAATKAAAPQVPSPTVTEQPDIPLSEQLEEIRTQLAWVRDYL